MNHSPILSSYTLGKCECVDSYNKQFLISTLNEKINDEKNYIKKIEYDRKFYEMREKYSPQYPSPDALIRIRKRIIDTAEIVKKRVENTPECK